MMAWIERRPLLAALVGLAILLAVAIGLEAALGTSAGGADGMATRAAAPTDAKLLPPVIAQAPEQAYPEMTARPLFTPTRRPAPADPSAGRTAFVRGQYVLQGVISVGDQRTAMLKEKATGRIFRVDRGKDVNGIVVEAIEPTQVTLALNGERENLELLVQRPDGKATAAAAAASAAAAVNPGDAGPFGAPQAAAPPAVPPQAAGAPGSNPDPRAIPTTPNPANPAAARGAQPTAQPMSPEELLARRRARRSSPTQ
jgi:general secretion pathway protein N